ncbi:hypothetical protein [Variovorax sp. UC122_21]|uniref:hypothetical protein n=1 Tax=Variovorax sp. UC122_21 TaxID=3374554 RepID=UPI003756F41D
MSVFNPWKALQALVAGPALQAGVVLSIESGVATIQLPGGGIVQAIGEATVGQTVFFRGNAIEGEALEALPIDVIEI